MKYSAFNSKTKKLSKTYYRGKFYMFHIILFNSLMKILKNICCKYLIYNLGQNIISNKKIYYHCI